MTRVVFTRRFERDVHSINSLRVLEHLRLAIDRIGSLPISASSDVPVSIVAEFGLRVRKIVIAPFDLICEFDEETDTVYLLALVYGKRAR